jgi:hypothetical protein
MSIISFTIKKVVKNNVFSSAVTPYRRMARSGESKNRGSKQVTRAEEMDGLNRLPKINVIPMPDVFLSYKRSDRSRVEKIAHLLREGNLDVWFDARLQPGRDEGFDAEIEREVTSAHCVVACWSREAVKSIYVRAEALKGLESGRFSPLFLEKCVLPVPFNAVDTVDLSDWSEDPQAPEWQRLLDTVQDIVKKSKADEFMRRQESRAGYERIDHKIYPGTLTLLVQRIAAIHQFDSHFYHEDIVALLDWIRAVMQKETGYLAQGYEAANRKSGGDEWRWWDRGGASERASSIEEIRGLLTIIDQALEGSSSWLDRPAP